LRRGDSHNPRDSELLAAAGSAVIREALAFFGFIMRIGFDSRRLPELVDECDEMRQAA
jgi:hypothetical protein